MPRAALLASPAGPHNDIQMWPYTAHCVSLQLTYSCCALLKCVLHIFYRMALQKLPFSQVIVFLLPAESSRGAHLQDSPEDWRSSMLTSGQVLTRARMLVLASCLAPVLITELNNFHRKFWISKREILKVQTKFYNLTSNISLAKIVPLFPKN